MLARSLGSMTAHIVPRWRGVIDPGENRRPASQAEFRAWTAENKPRFGAMMRAAVAVYRPPLSPVDLALYTETALCGAVCEVGCEPSALYTLCPQCDALREDPTRAPAAPLPRLRGLASRRVRRWRTRRGPRRRELRTGLATHHVRLRVRSD